MFAWRDNYISYNGAAASTGDPYWTSVSVLMNFDTPLTNVQDTSGINNLYITDGSNPGPYPNYRSPFTGSGGSSYFPGLSYIYKSTAFTQAGTSNWTVECWFYPTIGLASNQDIFVINGGTGDDFAQIRISYTNTGALYLLCGQSVAGWINTTTTAAATIAINSWYHIAAVRNGSVFTLYVNGVSKLTYSSAVSLYASYAGVSAIGAAASALGGRPITGFVSNFRYVLGTAVYTAAFTPPTSPLTAITNTQTLLPLSNIGASRTYSTGWSDLSQNIAVNVITNTGNPSWAGLSPFTNTYPGSTIYNGTTQYLTVASNSLFAYGTGDFTIEFWVRFNSVASTQYVLDQRANATPTSITPTIYMISTNFRYYVNGADRITGTTTLVANTWYAVSICRTGTSTKMFLNGVQEGSTYTDSNNYIAAPIRLASNASTAGNSLAGYMTSTRVSKGFAYYTSNYTPSTTPLSADSTYTSLLISGSAGSSAYDLSLNGNAGISSAVTTPFIYKFGTQSALVLAPGGTVSINDSTNTQMGTGDFTIEGWIYRTALGTAQSIAGKGTTTTGFGISINASNQLVFRATATNILTSTATIASATWTYFAWTRSGTTNYMFVDGTLQSSATDSTNYSQTNAMSIGSDFIAASRVQYIDDFRMTKGVCRYTATFTAPTSAFPTS